MKKRQEVGPTLTGDPALSEAYLTHKVHVDLMSKEQQLLPPPCYWGGGAIGYMLIDFGELKRKRVGVRSQVQNECAERGQGAQHPDQHPVAPEGVQVASRRHPVKLYLET